MGDFPRTTAATSTYRAIPVNQEREMKGLFRGFAVMAMLAVGLALSGPAAAASGPCEVFAFAASVPQAPPGAAAALQVVKVAPVQIASFEVAQATIGYPKPTKDSKGKGGGKKKIMASGPGDGEEDAGTPPATLRRLLT
jgi:hypothetical protein